MAFLAKTPVLGSWGQYSSRGLIIDDAEAGLTRCEGIVRRRKICLFGMGLRFRFLWPVVNSTYDFGRESSWRAMHAVSLGHLDLCPLWLGLEPGRKFPPSPGLLL